MSRFENIDNFCPAVENVGPVPIKNGKLDLSAVPKDKRDAVKTSFENTFPNESKAEESAGTPA